MASLNEVRRPVLAAAFALLLVVAFLAGGFCGAMSRIAAVSAREASVERRIEGLLASRQNPRAEELEAVCWRGYGWRGKEPR